MYRTPSNNDLLISKISDLRKKKTLKILKRCTKNDLDAVHDAYLAISTVVRASCDIHDVLDDLGFDYNTLKELSVSLFAIQSQLSMVLRGIDILDVN